MSKIADNAFKNHFNALLLARSLTPIDFYGQKVPRDLRVSKSGFFRTQLGYRPENQETITRYANILKCTPDEFMIPPVPKDWARSDVKQFLGNFSLFNIDGAIVLYRGPEREQDRHSWAPCDVIFEIEDRQVTVEDFPQFKQNIKKWEADNPRQQRGVKYCVTEVVALPTESGGTLSLILRPIEFHICKPVVDILAKSFKYDDAFAVSTSEGTFRLAHFAKLKRREQPLPPNYLVAHITVMTSDNQLLLFRRRQTGIGFGLGCWSASFEEGFNADWRKYLEPAQVYPPSSNTDNTCVAGLRRALREDLRLPEEDVAATEFSVLAFGVEFEHMITFLVALAKVPRRAEDILASDALKSNEEHDCFGYCPFEIPNLLPALLSKSSLPNGLVTPEAQLQDIKQNWQWHPTSRLRIYQGLAELFGQSVLDANLERQWRPKRAGKQ